MLPIQARQFSKWELILWHFQQLYLRPRRHALQLDMLFQLHSRPELLNYQYQLLQLESKVNQLEIKSGKK